MSVCLCLSVSSAHIGSYGVVFAGACMHVDQSTVVVEAVNDVDARDQDAGK